MPKISKHNGPSHKGEVRPQPATPQLPQAKQVTVTLDFTNVDERLASLVRRVVQADGGIVTGPVAITGNDPVEVYATGGVLNKPFYVGEHGPEQEILNAVIPEEVESSPGNSSSASTPKQPTSTEPSKPARRKPVRTMGSRSGQDQTGSSSASLTAGDLTEPTSATE